jgi:hypothetical protein
MVNVKKAGLYRFTLRQFPEEADKVVKAVRAKIQIAGKDQEMVVDPGSKEVVFELEIPAGRTELITYLFTSKGKIGGAYFTEVEAL